MTRREVWLRDGGLCQSPLQPPLCIGKETPLPVDGFHVDHIKPLSAGGTNHKSNLRVLCPVCHGLRADFKHRALTTKLRAKGLLPINWRDLVWE